MALLPALVLALTAADMFQKVELFYVMGHGAVWQAILYADRSNGP